MRHSKNRKFRLFALSLAACVGLIGATISIAGLSRKAEAQEASPDPEVSVVPEERSTGRVPAPSLAGTSPLFVGVDDTTVFASCAAVRRSIRSGCGDS